MIWMYMILNQFLFFSPEQLLPLPFAWVWQDRTDSQLPRVKLCEVRLRKSCAITGVQIFTSFPEHKLSDFFCFLFVWFLTHPPFDPLGGTLKQNVQLIKFQSCKTFILRIKAHALGNIWKKKENVETWTVPRYNGLVWRTKIHLIKNSRFHVPGNIRRACKCNWVFRLFTKV